MKYINAADVLPLDLLKEIQYYVNGDLLYIPNTRMPKKWGEKSGSRSYYIKRNTEIKETYKSGKSISELSDMYGLSYNTVKKIIYTWNRIHRILFFCIPITYTYFIYQITPICMI